MNHKFDKLANGLGHSLLLKNSLVLPVLVFGLGSMLAGRVTAQIFTTFYNSTPTYPATSPFGQVGTNFSPDQRLS